MARPSVANGKRCYSTTNQGSPRFLSTTTLQLADPDGKIVYPGFPADDLYYFRVYSFMAQCIFWGVIGFGTALVSKKAIHKAAVQAEKEKVAA